MALRILSPLHKASREIDLYLSPRMAAFHLSGGAHLLSYLAAYGPAPVGELTRVFGYRPSTLTSILDRLEAAGLAERSLDDNDRRSFRVAVTPAGRRTARSVTRIVQEFETSVLDRVTEAELAGFRAVLAAVHDVTQVTLRQRGGSHERRTPSEPVSSQPLRVAQKSGRHLSRRKSEASGRRR